MLETIDSNPQITYSEVNHVLRAVESYRAKLLKKGHREVTFTLKTYSDTYDMRIYFPYLAGGKIEIVVPLEDEFWRESVYIELVSAEGESRRFVVNMASQRSNLGKGYVGFFYCPQTERLCRKLYTDGLSLCSRYAFRRSYYNSQRASHSQSIALRRYKAEKRVEEAEEHKQTYKGKPTRWAIKAEKEAQREEYYSNIAFNGLMNTFARLSRKVH